MTAFLFTISFLLHIIAFVAIALLLKQLSQLKQHNHSENVIELLETYLQEIKEENRILQESVINNSLQDKNRTSKMSEQAATVKENRYMNTDEKNENYLVPEIAADDTTEMSLQAKILQLHAQGISDEQIAKKLGCGKTETELVIKLHNKNNE
ncbi:helix-turn-helix domain-containing protein [Virgibacillus oceani]|uniref:Coupling factor for flagellin transcription and translation n=1 Tax=Virgibacillus oceani TaxID=1479511 RepID=A0A917H615_9BACI|nr:helix-turn-helix domain-containing protein [Virgibacillus oceani]GGG68827.1 hypothetical protein GCM10011398_10950 [Virgibacillus oceani]